MTTSSYEGPPPIQHGPLGAPVHDVGPPVQAFVDSADDSWRPLPQPPLSAPPPPAEPSAQQPSMHQQPPADFGGTASESTQMWTPSDAFSSPSDTYSRPSDAYSGPSDAFSSPSDAYSRPSDAFNGSSDAYSGPSDAFGGPSAAASAPTPSSPPSAGGGLPHHIDPSSVVSGHDLVLPPSAQPEQTVPQPPMSTPTTSTPPMGTSSMGSAMGPSSLGQPLTSQPLPTQPPPDPTYQSSESDESVAERTMATWLSSSPASQAPDAPPPTQAYGMAPPPNGQGRNETAVLPEMPQGQQPGGWQSGGWQPSPHGAFAGPGGPGDPGPPPRSSGPSKPLIITVVGLVVVALIAIGVVVWPDGGKKQNSSASGQSPAAANTPASTKPNSVGRQEAIVVNKILNASAASRGGLAKALAAARTCRGLPTAIAGFQQVATQRKAQVAHAKAAKVGHLANGARLRQTLTRSIQYSLAADQSLLAWAQGKQGCHGKPKPDANYRRAGGPLSAQASASKAQFAALWAPVARQYHLPPRTANGF